MAERDFSPTPSTLLDLREERQVVQDGYHFLDEKRLSLAARIMEELQAQRQALAEWEEAREAAAAALAAAVGRHGLEDLGVQPPREPAGKLEVAGSGFLGVLLQRTAVRYRPGEGAPALDPSAEADACADAFARLTEAAARRATHEANLARLLDEYRVTARRARALEDVVLPELDRDVAWIGTAIEEQEQEEAVRARLHAPD
ncbi:V/A-type H+-transporting ATPase subunit D [Thiohalospira halophila DSM 15071]|uniref:V/A-type H+-transporting ATPase subunit D n=1 Tax=Thiohalospira halophila DSM 15071 TaxID=1123397 RepID=A0A1I1NJA7_9GAMM|nr:V-type ATP synthase subunit D [Thiohalospira halophila]SFC97794.1 V/A-type H+-transporting ATPase subunit D [Thiohalospira halophila DSM 15071]